MREIIGCSLATSPFVKSLQALLPPPHVSNNTVDCFSIVTVSFPLKAFFTIQQCVSLGIFNCVPVTVGIEMFVCMDFCEALNER